MRLGYKERLAILVGVQLAVLTLFVLVAYWPSVTATEKASSKIAELSERQAELCRMLQACPNPDQQTGLLKAEIQKLENRMPPESRVSWLSARIADAMQANSVDLRSTTDWSEGGDTPAATELKRLRKTVTISCTARNLETFLQSINRLPFVVVVEDLDISRDIKGGEVAANIKLATFVLRAPVAAPPQVAVAGRQNP